MKKLMWVALACSLFAVPSHAQGASPAEVSGGYSFFRVGGSGGTNMNGGSGSLAINTNDWLGLVGDFGVYHASPSGIGVTASTYTFGPRFSYRAAGKVVPFGEALFGGAHLSATSMGVSASTNPFAYSFGGGADLAMSKDGKVSLRPEFDYFGLRQNGTTENSIRIAVGIVFHIGQR
jgi:hypothetical protein